MGNNNVDWSKAPAEADGWMWDKVRGPVWVMRTGAFDRADSIDAAPAPLSVVAPIGAAPAFGWDGGFEGSVTARNRARW